MRKHITNALHIVSDTINMSPEPKKILQDGSVLNFSLLQDGTCIDPDTKETVILDQVGNSNTYRKEIPRNDGTTIEYYVDKPTDPTVTVSRKVTISKPVQEQKVNVVESKKNKRK